MSYKVEIYKVIRIFKNTSAKVLIEKNLSLEDAQAMVKGDQINNPKGKSMLCYTEQT